MYEFFSQISSYLTDPFLNMVYSNRSIPIFSAFILGLIGALAPCQFTGNLGAIMIYGNQSIQRKVAWIEVIYFILGKIVVFTTLGFIVWLLGKEFQQVLPDYLGWIRKFIGPLLVLIGLYMAGLFKMKWVISLGHIPEKYMKKGKRRAFLMGFSFSLGFCPTMFILFFLTLMPLSLTTSYGAALPALFAVGTSLPLIFAIFLLWYLGLSGSVMRKKGRKLGQIIQHTAGWVIFILGVLDTLTYWS